MAQHAAPSIENLHRLRALLDLRVQVSGNGLGIDVQDFV